METLSETTKCELNLKDFLDQKLQFEDLHIKLEILQTEKNNKIKEIEDSYNQEMVSVINEIENIKTNCTHTMISKDIGQKKKVCMVCKQEFPLEAQDFYEN